MLQRALLALEVDRPVWASNPVLKRPQGVLLQSVSRSSRRLETPFLRGQIALLAFQEMAGALPGQQSILSNTGCHEDKRVRPPSFPPPECSCNFLSGGLRVVYLARYGVELHPGGRTAGRQKHLGF